MGLEDAGVAYDDRRGIVVDDQLRTTNRRIYAAGDCCSAHKFTHVADAQARIVIQNALFFGSARASRLTSPRCTYTDPEIAHVGLDPAAAEQRGWKTDTIAVEMSTVDRAVLDGDEEGFLNVYLKRNCDRILGATLVAANAGDILGELSLAIDAGIGLKRIARVIHAYPTQAEIVKRAADAYNRKRLTPRVSKLFAMLMKWRR
jgi:pyruvate/2-oxoglutarate dehydrogenase complex dihydrolipoamide dehydrogenase (E3) component